MLFSFSISVFSADVLFLSMFRSFLNRRRCFCQCSSVFQIRRVVFANVPMFSKSDALFLPVFHSFLNRRRCFCQCSSVFQIRRIVFDNVPMFFKSDALFLPVFQYSSNRTCCLKNHAIYPQNHIKPYTPNCY